MKRTLNSPDNSPSIPLVNFNHFYELIQEIICINNVTWSQSLENVSHFTTELIQYGKSSCYKYQITNFDHVQFILDQLLHHYPEYHNILQSTHVLLDAIICRNKLNNTLMNQYAQWFSILFKRKWHHPNHPSLSTFQTPLQSNTKAIDVIFNHGYNILLYIKSLYDLNTNTNHKICFGFLACLLQDMYTQHLPNTIPISCHDLDPKQQSLILTHPHPIIAFLFHQWQFKFHFIPQFYAEFIKCKSLLPTNIHEEDYTSFNQCIYELYLQPDELGLDICLKPQRLTYAPCKETRRLKQATCSTRSRTVFTEESTTQSSNALNNTSTLKPIRPLKQLAQLLPHITPVDANTELQQPFTKVLGFINHKRHLFQKQHDLPDFPILDIIAMLLHHCHFNALTITDDLLLIFTALLFDIWYNMHHPNTFFLNNAYQIMSVQPMSLLLIYPIIQTANYYKHKTKTLLMSIQQHHAINRHVHAFPEPLEHLFDIMKQHYCLYMIWQQPELYNTSALYYLKHHQQGSDSERAGLIMTQIDPHIQLEIQQYYQHHQDMYQQLRMQQSTTHTFNHLLDYIPHVYLEESNQHFIMYVFVALMDESVKLLEEIFDNMNTEQWTVDKSVVLDKCKRLLVCVILKEDRFRMLDYRNMAIMITCLIFGMLKYLQVKIQLNQVIGAMLLSGCSSVLSVDLFHIYDKTLTNNTIVYCDLVVFYNTHVVPTFGGLIRHFSKTVFYIN